MKFETMIKKSLGIGILSLSVLAGVAVAQEGDAPPVKTKLPTLDVEMQGRQVSVANGNNLYCAGFIQTAPVSTNVEIVGAEQEQEQHAFKFGDYIYINSGANSGVKVGDLYSVMRPRGIFKSPFSSKGDLGRYVQEVGAVEIVKVKSEVSVAKITTSCEVVLMGDLVQPMTRRTSADTRKQLPLDRFAEPNGKTTGRIVLARDNREMLARDEIVYIDLGSENGISAGEYLTIFRPLGKGNVTGFDQSEILHSQDYGFESERYRGGKQSSQAPRNEHEKTLGGIETTPEATKKRPKGLRKIVGEMVILSVHEKTATAVITRVTQEVHTGDMVELQ